MSANAKKSAINKLYCKNTRRKNKEYTKELEAKVDALENKVLYLTSQIDKYKYKMNVMAIGDEKDLSEFKNLEDFGKTDLLNSLKNGAGLDDLKNKIHKLSKTAGSAGKDRQKLIKTAFKVIIENMLPERMRILFNIVKEESTISFEDYRKLFSMNQK